MVQIKLFLFIVVIEQTNMVYLKHRLFMLPKLVTKLKTEILTCTIKKQENSTNVLRVRGCSYPINSKRKSKLAGIRLLLIVC